MTGYTVHTGSSEQFTQGWDRIFSDKTKKSAKQSKKSTTRKKATKKKTTKAKAGAKRKTGGKSKKKA